MTAFTEIDEDDNTIDLDEIDIRSQLPPARNASDLYGHADIEKRLLADIQAGRMPHAVIFAGPEGVGKSVLAFRLARYLLADTEFLKPAEDDAGFNLFGDAPAAPPAPARSVENMFIAPESTTFAQVSSGGHPDLLVIERPYDEKKGRHKAGIDVDEVRKVVPFLRKTSANSGWRVVIVDDSDSMNRNAQNAILKILEEPPQKTLIILIAHRIGTFLPTIRSRARVIRMEGLDKSAFNALLSKSYPRLSGADLDRLALICAGSPGRAVRLFEMGGLDVLEQILSLTSNLPALDRMQLHKFAERFVGSDADGHYLVLINMLDWIFGQITRNKAAQTTLPLFLKSSGLFKVAAGLNLDGWLKICDSVKATLTQGASASLDRRMVLLTAFRSLSSGT